MFQQINSPMLKFKYANLFCSMLNAKQLLQVPITSVPFTKMNQFFFSLIPLQEIHGLSWLQKAGNLFLRYSDIR